MRLLDDAAVRFPPSLLDIPVEVSGPRRGFRLLAADRELRFRGLWRLAGCEDRAVSPPAPALATLRPPRTPDRVADAAKNSSTAPHAPRSGPGDARPPDESVLEGPLQSPATCRSSTPPFAPCSTSRSPNRFS